MNAWPHARRSRAGAQGGTRFRLFPQGGGYFDAPLLVHLSPPPGTIGPGPADHRMRVIDALGKQPYDPPNFSPPWPGPVGPPVPPGPDGHFDHLQPGTEAFRSAHLYASIRLTLDIWERYLGHELVWWHRDIYPRMELIPFVDWQNAQSGPGFMEMGWWPDETGARQDFALNYDVMAHETGHAILFSEIGVPDPTFIDEQFLAFHESFSDLTALIGTLHVVGVIEKLLDETGGDLYVLNLVNRIGAVSAHRQIRIASNETVMGDVDCLRLAPDGSWIDPTGAGRNAHWLAQPLTGAIFDTLVEFFQDGLVDAGLIAPDDDARGWTRAEVEASLADRHGGNARAYARFAQGFTDALAHARDLIGGAMAHLERTLRPDEVSFDRVAARLIEFWLDIGLAPLLPAILSHYLWRGIDPRPYLRLRALPPPRPAARLALARRFVSDTALVVDPAPPRPRCGCGLFAHFLTAGRLMPHAHRARGPHVE